MRQINKAWGHELVFADTETYCGKFLVFYKAGNKFSMHFHKDKQETWYVQQGAFDLITINTNDGSQYVRTLRAGDTYTNLPLEPHQLLAKEDDSVIIEVSTRDSAVDNYRVAPGDSQQDLFSNL